MHFGSSLGKKFVRFIPFLSYQVPKLYDRQYQVPRNISQWFCFTFKQIFRKIRQGWCRKLVHWYPIRKKTHNYLQKVQICQCDVHDNRHLFVLDPMSLLCSSSELGHAALGNCGIAKPCSDATVPLKEVIADRTLPEILKKPTKD